MGSNVDVDAVGGGVQVQVQDEEAFRQAEKVRRCYGMFGCTNCCEPTWRRYSTVPTTVPIVVMGLTADLELHNLE